MFLEKYTILVVDDSPEDQETLQRYLLRDQTYTYEIFTVQYAAEGLRFCDTQWPDLIILDYLLPDSNGIQFIDALQNKAQSVPMPAILVLTGQGNEQVAVALMKMGVKDYLNKNKLTELDTQSTVRRILSQVRLERSLAIQTQWQQVLSETALRIRKSTDLSTVLDTATQEIQQFLRCDRVIIYRFAPNARGMVISETVKIPWQSVLGVLIDETCFQMNETLVESYRQGRQLAIADIYQADLSDCHIRLLEQFQVRAVLAVPILLTTEETAELPHLWGLIIAHQCGTNRRWSDPAITFLSQISVHLAIAIQQTELLQRLNQELVQRIETEQALRAQTDAQQSLIQTLAQTTELLRLRNEDLDAFVSIASHDLRAPLRAIRNLATWLAEDLASSLDSDTQQQFNLLILRVAQMDALLSDLLEYSRIGRVENRVVEVNVGDLLSRIVLGIEVPPDFNIAIQPNMPTLLTHPTALEQVFSNLVGNAVKHHNRLDGRVEISATLQDDQIYCFVVADDGPGIAPEHHERIFEIFKTLNQTRTVENTGVGLAIVKKTIEVQGGKITVESAGNQGTTFRFTWPIGDRP